MSCYNGSWSRILNSDCHIKPHSVNMKDTLHQFFGPDIAIRLNLLSIERNTDLSDEIQLGQASRSVLKVILGI